MKEYVSPELEIIDIAGDVITASGACDKDMCLDAIKCVCGEEKCMEKCICADAVKCNWDEKCR